MKRCQACGYINMRGYGRDQKCLGCGQSLRPGSVRKSDVPGASKFITSNPNSVRNADSEGYRAQPKRNPDDV